ncbi:MAG: DUF4143 domain-containing protein [Thermoanaerobaculia bacterium]
MEQLSTEQQERAAELDHDLVSTAGRCELFYWREHSREVDFVVRKGRTLTAIEVKSSAGRTGALSGMAAFSGKFSPTRTLLVGGDGIPIGEFLGKPVEHWIAG